MANPEHVKWLLEEGVNAWNERREQLRFKPDFFLVELRAASLQGANLRGADLRGADLREAILQGTDMRNADLQGVKLREANLRAAILRDSDLREANLLRADLQEANLMGANMREADLLRAILVGANMREADLLRANLREVDLRDANLRGANLRGANLQGANLQGADLLRADLQSANISTLKSALRKKRSGRADFALASNLVQLQVEGMNGDTGVLLPEGLRHPEHWPKWEKENNNQNAARKEDLDQNQLSDPVEQEIRLKNRIGSLSPLSAKLDSNKLKAISGPLGARPTHFNSAETETLFRAIDHGSFNFLIKYKEDHLQLPKSLQRHFKEARRRARQKSFDWFIWENLIASINGPITDPYYKDDWRGAHELASLVLRNIRLLQPYLTHVTDGVGTDEIELTAHIDKDTFPKVRSLSSSLGKLIATEEDRLYPGTPEILRNEKGALDMFEDEGLTSDGFLGEARESDLKKTLFRVAGFVVGGLKALGASSVRVSENTSGATIAILATTPSAHESLISALMKLWEIVKTFFI
ncbi:pentapeptide repeat-containing protein [Labrenzia sp. 5N]|uniref:pentapeptide repeat-containing protein n=1 Tax=Labrenzia sp. 5N TaxID=2723402 RepID=UPI001447A89D|nr:pentapeptide repeat-containing protein [Labrenzia sp. 5N]NKX66974.1 pentapeptide repeat-containing protein [Labrenzia sp. 5N]